MMLVSLPQSGGVPADGAGGRVRREQIQVGGLPRGARGAAPGLQPLHLRQRHRRASSSGAPARPSLQAGVLARYILLFTSPFTVSKPFYVPQPGLLLN